MASGSNEGDRRVVVVTGGAAGIGATIAEELGRNGAFVVTMDPVLSVDGSTRIAAPEQSTAQRILEAGGTARASDTSVTDQLGVKALFAELVDEFGSLDVVVNVAGIARPTGFAAGTEEDWAAVLSVHLDGYLNVLRAALPIMAEAGHGRILGVTSGSGWRPVNTGAYGCAKRAVAALTWQIGQSVPNGVTVNALSPLATTRMVSDASSRLVSVDNRPEPATGGPILGSVRRLPEYLGPLGAYLASELFSWCSGQVLFSGGTELSLIAPPQLLEVCRSADVPSLPHALDTVIPITFAAAEAEQRSNGGSNPRFGPVFDEPMDTKRVSGQVRSCVIVTDDAVWGATINDAFAARGVDCVGVGAWQGALGGPAEIARGFSAAAEQIAGVARNTGPLDAVVVALVDGVLPIPDDAWQQILDGHGGITDHIRSDASWARAVSDYAADTERPVRLVTITNAASPGGKSRAQAAAQLARAAHIATQGRVDAFAISVETPEASERRPVSDLIAHLVTRADTAVLSGAELVAGSGWLGLRSHPGPAATISFGGPEIPAWLDDTVRRIVTGSKH